MVMFFIILHVTIHEIQTDIAHIIALLLDLCERRRG